MAQSVEDTIQKFLYKLNLERKQTELGDVEELLNLPKNFVKEDI